MACLLCAAWHTRSTQCVSCSFAHAVDSRLATDELLRSKVASQCCRHSQPAGGLCSTRIASLQTQQLNRVRHEARMANSPPGARPGAYEKPQARQPKPACTEERA